MTNALIYIIFGASGSGKTTLIAQLKQLQKRITIHEKVTTRDLRSYDELELKKVTEEVINKYNYVYSNYGYKYGIEKKQIEESILIGKHHFIICNDRLTITQIKKDFNERVRVIFLLFDKLEDTLLEIQKERYINDDEISLRIQKYRALNQEFIENRSLFDAIILNKFGAPQIRMYNQAVALMNVEEGKENPEMAEILLEIKKLTKSLKNISEMALPSLSKNETPVQQNFVFIAMAMDPNEPTIPDILNTIKRTCNEMNMVAQRADERFDGGVLITPKMLNHIRTAEVVIADLTFEKPNVYYEVGYAHACSKKVILTIRDGHNVHFDLRGYETIYYKNFSELEKKLKDALAPFSSV